MFKHYILYSLVILVCGLLLLILRWPQGIYKTFSHHAAAQKFTIVYYVCLFLLVLPLLYLFFALYFVPHFGLSETVLHLIAASCVTQIGCTLVPETGGIKTTIHKILAGASALLLVVILGYLFAATASQFDRVVVGASMAIMLTIVLIAVFLKKTPLPLLLLQSVYFGFFFFAILVVTYRS